MTPEDAKKVLQAARDAALMSHWADIGHLLHPVYSQGILSGADQGDAAYLLGLAAMGTGDWDAAPGLFTEAAKSASASYRAEAKTRLGELKHQTDAVAAEADQDVDQKESAAVLAAGDEALAREDYDGAYGHYSAVYNGHADKAARAMGALGIATVLSHRSDLKEAKQYAKYVTGTGVPDAVARATTLLEWIAGQEAALAATADGTTIDEYAAADEAARMAFASSDYERARVLLTSLLDSPQLGAVERGKAALNLAMAQMLSGMYDDARLNFEIAATHGAAKVVERAHKYQEMLDRRDQAESLVAEYED